MKSNGLLLLTVVLILGCGRQVDKPGAGKLADSESVAGDAAKKSVAKDPASDSKTAAESPELTAESEFRVLNKAYRNALSEFFRNRRAAPEEEQAAMLSSGLMEEYAIKFLAFADEHPETEAAAKAVDHAAKSGKGPNAIAALERMIAIDPNDETVVDRVKAMASGIPSKAGEYSLDQLIATATENSVKGQAMMEKLKFLGRLSDYVGLANNRDILVQYPAEAKYLASKSSFDSRLVVSGLLDELESDTYSAIPYGGGSTLGKEAASFRFILENLSVGSVAMEISGPDMDGEEFQLSDYRGKVVLLDFWGDW